MEKRYFLIGNLHSGVFNLDALLSRSGLKGSYLLLYPRRYSMPELLDIEKLIDTSVYVIHLHRKYEEILSLMFLENEEIMGKKSYKQYSEICKALYCNDNWISTLQQGGRSFISVDCGKWERDLKRVQLFLEIEDLLKEPCPMVERDGSERLKNKKPSCLKYSKMRVFLEFFEGLRTFFHNIQFLSDIGRASLGLNREKPKREIEHKDFLKKEESLVSIFIDIRPAEEVLKDLLKDPSPGEELATVCILFSSFFVVEKILKNPFYTHFLQEGRLKLWQVLEWDNRFAEERKNLRTALYANVKIIALEGCILERRIQKELKLAWFQFCKEEERSREALLKYYQGSAFRNRLREVLSGKPPRIYVERACSSIAVKRYSDHCAKTFEELGCEVFLHKPCLDGSLDHLQAMHIEINFFRPDIVVRSPNIFLEPKSISIAKGPPFLYSLQDIQPHVDYVKHLEKNSINERDFVFFILPQFYDQYIDFVSRKDQLICHLLPAEDLVVDCSQDSVEPQYDIGFVKTMGRSRFLKDMVQTDSKEKRGLADEIYEDILYRVKNRDVPDIMEYMEKGKSLGWDQEMVHCFHQETCIHFIDVLYNSGYHLSLTGANWSHIQHLKKFARGHVEDRKKYQMRFLENKINLSMESWAQYHPRIFEGGACGAFFLVYRSPEKISLYDLPKILKEGEHFDSFSTPKELQHKCEFYLKNPEVRKRIGRNLQKAIRENFSYRKFCKELLDRFRSFGKEKKERI